MSAAHIPGDVDLTAHCFHARVLSALERRRSCLIPKAI
jgi:hypothetical protein